MIIKNHYFFILLSNPWPFLARISSFNLIFRLLNFLKFRRSNLIILNLIILILIRFFWWFSYRGELSLEGKTSSLLEEGLKFSIILFISSELFFFFSFFWRYFHFFLSPNLEIGLNWPPKEILSFDYLNVPLINTLILLSSGVTVTIAHYMINKNYYKNFCFFLLLTFILGCLFTFLQVAEYNSSFFSMGDGVFGTSFFILTGFHGIHVIIGSIFLRRSFFRTLNLISSNPNFTRFELASWYWHFVDVVWIFLYFFLYFLNN